jgi:hypothetical protein
VGCVLLTHTLVVSVTCCVTQGLLDVIAADDNAKIKVLRLRIKDEASNQGSGANMLAPMEGDDPASCAPPVDDSTVGAGVGGGQEGDAGRAVCL